MTCKKKYFRMTIVGLFFLAIIIMIIYFLGGDKMYFYDAEIINSAKNNICIDENNYEKNMQDQVLNFINKYEQTGFFNGVDNINLFYKKFELENPKACIVIIHGFSEHTKRYDELIYYFLRNNYSVYIYDQRGHGLSDRLTENNNMVYVKNFDDYACDLKIFLDKIVFSSQNKIDEDKNKNKNLFLYCHSMGGAVVTRFFEIYKPNNINLVILSAPMLEIITKPYSKRVANLICDAGNLAGQEEKYCPGHGDFNPKNRPDKKIYGDYIRYNYNANLEAKDLKLVTSGASFKWFKEAMKATRKIFDDDNINAINKINTRFYLFQYGEDKTVGPSAQNRFASLINNCELYKINSSEHNIYFMNNSILNMFLDKIFEIFDSYIKDEKNNG